MVPLALFVLLVFLFTPVSRRLEGTIVTAPIVFTGGGNAVVLCFAVVYGLVWSARPGLNRRYDNVSEEHLSDGVKTYAAWLARA